MLFTLGSAWGDEPVKPAAESAKSAADAKPAAEPAKSTDETAKPAAEPAKPAAESAKPAPATYTVKRSPLRITVDLDGILEAQTAREIAVRPEDWSSLIVASAVPHGARVRKDDVLLSLETEKLDRAIADLRADLQLSEVAIRQDRGPSAGAPTDHAAGSRNQPAPRARPRKIGNTSSTWIVPFERRPRSSI